MPLSFKMKLIIITSILLIIGQLTFAQSNERWIAFYNEEADLIGFKNAKGEIMIEPNFMGFTIAKTFDNIIAVMEENNGKYDSYYLTKSGKKVGYDKLHIIDNGADCEREGFIRFRDSKTDKVGMFDTNGNIAIPAVYNELSKTYNGMIWALLGAEKKYWDDHKESGCNHYSWKDGQKLLLSTDNKVLVDNFEYENHIDYFSFRLTKEPSTESTEISFKGKNEMYYTFTDIEKSFDNWLKNNFLNEPTKDKLVNFSMDSLTYWKGSWITESKEQFIEQNFDLIINKLNVTLNTNSDSFVTINGLNPFIYTGDIYANYFNTCGESIEEKHPVLAVIINNRTASDLKQDHFEFLKTENGYRFLSFSISSEK